MKEYTAKEKNLLKDLFFAGTNLVSDSLNNDMKQIELYWEGLAKVVPEGLEKEFELWCDQWRKSESINDYI